MVANTSITLNPHWQGFIKRLLKSGRYGSTSEVIRESLRLLEEREEKLNALRHALIEGEKSGPAEPFDRQKFLDEMKEKHGGG